MTIGIYSILMKTLCFIKVLSDYVYTVFELCNLRHVCSFIISVHSSVDNCRIGQCLELCNLLSLFLFYTSNFLVGQHFPLRLKSLLLILTYLSPGITSPQFSKYLLKLYTVLFGAVILVLVLKVVKLSFSLTAVDTVGCLRKFVDF